MTITAPLDDLTEADQRAATLDLLDARERVLEAIARLADARERLRLAHHNAIKLGLSEDELSRVTEFGSGR